MPSARTQRTRLIPLGGRKTYADDLIGIFGASAIGIWPYNEGSGTVADDKSAESNNATYNANVVLGSTAFLTGETSISLPANTSFVDLYSAAFNSDFTGQEFTAMTWANVASARWSDGATRRAMLFLVDASNFWSFGKSNFNNRFAWTYRAGGTDKSDLSADLGSSVPTGWFHMALVVSKAGDYVRFYLNGVQLNADLTGLGTWAGNLSSAQTLVGAENKANGNPWLGNQAYTTIVKRPATAAEIVAAYNAAF